MAAETKANSLTTMTKPTPDGALNSDGYGNPLVDQYRPTPTAKYITDEMRQDWEENREGLTAFWRSEEIPTTETLAEYGIKVSRYVPWLKTFGDRDSLPWAATEFDGE